MERLGSAKWLEIFERFRDLKKVEYGAIQIIRDTQWGSMMRRVEKISYEISFLF